MNARKASTEMGRGRGNYPLPLHPIPKYKTPVVYTEELTHLDSPYNIGTTVREKKRCTAPSCALSDTS